MWKFPKLPFYASVGAIPESYLLSLSYEEQILWLCSQVQAIKEGTPNYNYELLENKPSINNIPLIGNLTPEQLGLSNDYNIISNKPLINGVIVTGNKSGTDYGLQNQLIAGSGISIVGNTISATGGGGGGGTTDYNELSNKPSLNLVTIEGHKDFRDYGIQPQLQVNVTGVLTEGYTYDISNLSVNDVILPYTSNTSEVKYSAIRQVTSNGACKILDVKNGERYYFRGVVQFVSIGEDNEVSLIWDNPNNTYYDDLEFTATGNRTLLVSFFNISLTGEPRILQVQMGESIAESHLRNEVSTNEAKYDIEKLLLENAEYKSKTLNTGKYFDFDANKQLIEINQLNTSSLLIDLSENPIYNRIKIKGKAIEHYMFLFADSTREVIKLCPQNLAYFDEYIYLNIPEEATYLAISFFDTNNFAPSLEVVEMADTKGEGNFYTEIDQNLVLNYDGSINVTLESGKYYRLMPTRSLAFYKDVSGTPTLDSAIDMKNSILYYTETTSSKSITITGINEHNDEYIYQELFWLNSSNGWHYSTLKTNEVIQNGVSSIPQSTRSTIPSSGNDNDVPTISAVRTYVGSRTNFYTEIDQDVTLNLDGTTNYNFESNKYYLLKPNCHIYYYDSNNTLHSAPNMEESIFYYEEDYSGSTLTQKVITRTGVNKDLSDVSNESLTWTPENNYWYHSYSNYLHYVSNNYPSHLSSTQTTLYTTGHDYDIPTIKAVRNHTANFVNGGAYITNIWKGTQSAYDLIDPKSPTTMYIIE